MNLNFVKGHMGGNTILLLPGGERDSSWIVDTALQLLEQKYLCSHQAGFLCTGDKKDSLKVRIVGFSTRGLISACGGLTQVLGVAVRGGFLEHLGIPLSKKKGQILLETEGGEVTIDLLDEKKGHASVLTDLTSFVQECYELGMERISLEGVNALKIGKFLVINAEELRSKNIVGNFETFDAEALSILKTLQSIFQKQCKTQSCDFALFDWSKTKKGFLRSVFPHGIERGHVEPACGTGSVAVGLAVLLSKENLKGSDLPEGRIEFFLETGGGAGLVGDEFTRLVLEVNQQRIEKAFFSHSKVEIIATGSVFI